MEQFTLQQALDTAYSDTKNTTSSLTYCPTVHRRSKSYLDSQVNSQSTVLAHDQSSDVNFVQEAQSPTFDSSDVVRESATHR